MSRTGDMWIEAHNARMESDEDYADEIRRQDAEYQAWFEWREDVIEKETNWFPESRLDHSGYEEIEPEVGTVFTFDTDDLPF